MRTIKIVPALNGYICHVGCQMVLFISPELMCSEILRYLKNPDVVEGEYRKLAVNPIKDCPPTCEPPCLNQTSRQAAQVQSALYGLPPEPMPRSL